MKTINFNTNDFALTTNVLGIMQASYQLIQQMSTLLGSKFVISGCADNDTWVDPGVVCIDGEIMATAGGHISNLCRVVETPATTTIQDGSYTVNEKKLEFSSSGDFSWSDVKRLDSLEDVIAEVANLGLNKENAFDKNTGFNLNKSDGVTSSTSTTLATSKAANTAYNKGVEALNAANTAQSTANAKITTNVVLTSGSLNDVKTPGLYYCGSDADAGNISQSPLSGKAFSLLVENTSNAKQTWTDVGHNPRTFVRTYHSWNGIWGEWIEQTHTYTTFAQLELADADFSQTDWDANARLVFDRMTANSKFQAGLCGLVEMPRLSASLVASGIADTVALEFNKEANTSAPCLVWAKRNNSSNQFYYNVDDSGSEWVQLQMVEDTGYVDCVKGDAFVDAADFNVRVRKRNGQVVVSGICKTTATAATHGDIVFTLPDVKFRPNAGDAVSAPLIASGENGSDVETAYIEWNGILSFQISRPNSINEAGLWMPINLTYFVD